MAELELDTILKKENPATNNGTAEAITKKKKPAKQTTRKKRKPTQSEPGDLNAFWDVVERDVVGQSEKIKRLNIDVPESFNDKLADIASEVRLNKSQLVLKILHNAVDSYEARKLAREGTNGD